MLTFDHLGRSRCWPIVVLCGVVAITAFGGAVALIAAPDGSLVHMTTAELRHSPFSTFLVPGLLLGGVIAGLNIAALVLVLQRARLANHAAFAAGSALLVWTTTEIVMLRAFHFLQPVYLIIGVAIMLEALRHERASRAARRTTHFAIDAALPLAALLAGLSLAGPLTAAYARESASWSAQAIAQDWFDLVIAAPWLAICGIGARHGSYRWRVLLAGAYAYTAYESCIYAFAVHFNSLFLVYCAALGLSGYALIALTLDLSRDVVRVDARASRVVGGFLVALGTLFAVLWLSEDVPAVLHNAPSQALADSGLLTNPVHVIDLAFVLPAHVLAGKWMWRQRRSGDVLAPIVLAFGVLMAASIGGMMLVIWLSDAASASIGVAIAMFAVAAITAAMLARAIPIARVRLQP